MTYKKIGLFLFLTSDPGNYHPINLASLPIKIMECKDRENIMKLLEDNGIVSSEQDGVENNLHQTIKINQGEGYVIRF